MLFSKRELKFSRSFLSNMKKGGLNIALPFFLVPVVYACVPNTSATVPVVAASPNSSPSPVNGTWQEGSLPNKNPSRVNITQGFGSSTGNTTTVSGNESTNTGFASNTGSKPSIGGSSIGGGSINDCSTSTATFGKTSGSQQIDVKLTPCPKATSAGNPW